MSACQHIAASYDAFMSFGKKKITQKRQNILEAAQLKERSPSEIHVYSICTEDSHKFTAQEPQVKETASPQTVK